MIDLQRFCANEFESRVGLQRPWRDGAWVYATNGRLIVRVPSASVQDAPLRNVSQPKNAPALFEMLLDKIDGDFLVMPPLPERKQCSFCFGGGADDDGDECLECYGTKYEWVRFPLGDTEFNLHYLHEISTLPQVRIRTNGDNAAALVFDGGQALLMPMRSFDSAWRQPLPNPLTPPVVQRDPSLWGRVADWWMTPRGAMLACIVSAAGVISLVVAIAAH